MAFKRYKRSKTERVRLHENEVAAIEEIRRKDRSQRQNWLFYHRNSQLVQLCVCLLEQVAVDPGLSAKRGFHVIERMPKGSSTGCQTLYAGMLLRSILEDNPEIDVCESMEDYEFPDGSPLIERD